MTPHSDGLQALARWVDPAITEVNQAGQEWLIERDVTRNLRQQITELPAELERLEGENRTWRELHCHEHP